jgi:hypothetical protein
VHNGGAQGVLTRRVDKGVRIFTGPCHKARAQGPISSHRHKAYSGAVRRPAQEIEGNAQSDYLRLTISLSVHATRKIGDGLRTAKGPAPIATQK